MARRWPFEPLQKHIPHEITPTALRHDWLEMNDTDWQFWRHNLTHYMLTDERADMLACRLGLHPVLIWDGWVDNHQTELFEDHLEAA